MQNRRPFKVDYNDPMSVSRAEMAEAKALWMEKEHPAQVLPTDMYSSISVGTPYSYNYDEAQRKIMISESEQRVAKKFNEIYFVPPQFKMNVERDLANKRAFEIERQVLRRQDRLQSLFEDVFKTTRDPRVSPEVDKVLREIDSYAAAYNLTELQKEQLRIEVLKSDLVNFVRRGIALDEVGLVADAAADLGIGDGDTLPPPPPPGPAVGAGGEAAGVPGVLPGGSEVPDLQPNFQPDIGGDELGMRTDQGDGLQLTGPVPGVRFGPDGGLERPILPERAVRENYETKWLPGFRIYEQVLEFYTGEGVGTKKVFHLTKEQFQKSAQEFGLMTDAEISREFSRKGKSGKGRSVRVKSIAAVLKDATQIVSGSRISDREYQTLGRMAQQVGFFFRHATDPSYNQIEDAERGDAAARP